MKIIALCGFIGSGKDTAADYLVSDCGFLRGSFAGTLKDSVSVVFGWDRELLEGKTKEARDWREKVDPWWADRLAIPHLTPRWVLQYWGTEVCRVGFHTDIWVASLENKVLRLNHDVVISDCRFTNEVDAMRKLGAQIVRVRRGPEPAWINLGISACDKSNPHQAQAVNQLNALSIHASEWSWLGTKFDRIIENEGSLEDLHREVRSLASMG